MNRRLIELHEASDQLTCKVSNPHTSENRDLLFFSDPPHLIKKTRNCWASKARQLWVNTQHMSLQCMFKMDANYVHNVGTDFIAIICLYFSDQWKVSCGNICLI